MKMINTNVKILCLMTITLLMISPVEGVCGDISTYCDGDGIYKDDCKTEADVDCCPHTALFEDGVSCKTCG